jgi:branched-chain amino acid transport system permease protein
LTADILPSVPFAVTAVALLVFLWRRRAVDEAVGVGGALDRALAARGSLAGLTSRATTPVRGAGSGQASLGGFVIIAVLPLVLPGFWVGMLEQGVAYGIVFLSMTLVTGEGGMIWLCQATFAGVGAVTMAQLAAHHGWPVLAAAVAGALLASVLGLLVGALTIRLGDIYVALVTLTFGLVTEMLVLDQNVFANFGRGVAVSPPHFATGPRVFTWLELAIFGLLGLGILNLRRSTTGLALNAARWSLPAARTTGIAVLQVKVLVSGLAAFVAGLGGALLAIALGDSLPSNYSTLGGILWLVVLVVLGIRSVMASLLAGLVFTIVTELAFVYLPSGLAGLIPLIFGLGATQIARFPDGWLGIVPRRILARRTERSPVAGRPAPSTAPPASA